MHYNIDVLPIESSQSNCSRQEIQKGYTTCLPKQYHYNHLHTFPSSSHASTSMYIDQLIRFQVKKTWINSCACHACMVTLSYGNQLLFCAPAISLLNSSFRSCTCMLLRDSRLIWITSWRDGHKISTSICVL